MTYQYHPSLEDQQFVDFLFSKLVKHTDTELLDLHDSDACDDHLQYEQLTLPLDLP